MSDQQEITFTAAKGLVGGSGATIAAVVSQWQDQLAFWLGIAVATLTLISIALDICRKMKRKD